MSEPPRITVAIPTMNGARHIAETLQGILGQHGVMFDLLVSDDRSEDNTRDRVRQEAGDRVRVVVNSERLGLAGNWNQCVALARTPLVAIVHQDDILLPGHLASVVERFRGDDSIGLVACASVVIDEHGRDVPERVVGRGGLGPVDRVFAPGEAIEALAGGNPLRCSAVALQVAAHADIGGFDPSLRYVVDWDFWVRVARRWSVAWRARPSVAVRWHPASETHRFKSGTTDLEETERVLAGLLGWSGPQPIPLRAIPGPARRKLGRAYLNRAHDSAWGGDARLTRHCLRRALTLAPGLLGRIIADPRLAARLVAGTIAPGRGRGGSP